jgi:hypothetical protein
MFIMTKSPSYILITGNNLSFYKIYLYFRIVSRGQNKRSVNEKVAKKSSADKQLQLPSVPIGLGQKQASSEFPHRQPTSISIPPATGIYAIFTSFYLLFRFLDCH